MNNMQLMLYIIAVILGLIALWIIEVSRDKSIEGFAGAAAQDIQITFCPFAMKTYYTSKDGAMCCEGALSGNTCLGKPRCAFGPNSAGLPLCSKLYTEYTTEKGRTVCPASMPNYFEKDGLIGCTAGPISPQTGGPLRTGDKFCKVYAKDAENKSATDSCYNQRRADAYPCFGRTCTKTIISFHRNFPALIQVNFTDSMGMPHISYTRDSARDFLMAVGHKSATIDSILSGSEQVTEVAKAKYIDRIVSGIVAGKRD